MYNMYNNYNIYNMSTIYSNKDFEDKIQKFLLKTKRVVLSSVDIKNRFGYNININHLVELDNICLCFKDIHKKSYTMTTTTNTTNTTNTLNTYIDLQQFVTDVINITNIMQKICIGIIITNIDLSLNDKKYLEYENNKNINQYIIFYDDNYGQLIKKILHYFYSNNLYFYDGEDCVMIH